MTEYLVSLLQGDYKLATLSRGYPLFIKYSIFRDLTGLRLVEPLQFAEQAN